MEDQGTAEIDSCIAASSELGCQSAPECDLGPGIPRRKYVKKHLVRGMESRLQAMGIDAIGKHGVQTPNIAIIAARIDEVYSRWNNARVARLCAAAGAPIHAVCAACGMLKKNNAGTLATDFESIARCWEKDWWPVSVVMHFDNMEKLWLTSKS